MAKILPVTNQPAYEVSVVLDGKSFLIKSRWNTRTGSWYLAIDDSQGNPVIGFEKISERQQIITYNLDNFANGNLFAFPTNSSSDRPLTRENFGVGLEWELVYLSFDEIVELVER